MDINNINNEQDLNVVITELRNKLKVTNAYRDPVISKLSAIVDKIEIDFENDRPTMIEAKLGVITKLDDLLKSKESNEINSVKITMQKRVDDANVNYQEQTIAVLKNIAPSAIINNSEEFVQTEALSDEVIEDRIANDPNLAPISEAEMDLSESGNDTAFTKNA